MKSILVSSGYGGNTREPFVMIEADEIDQPIQLSPAEARDLAANLFQAAEAAEGDAFIVEFATRQLKSDDQDTRVLLLQFRKFRESMRGEQ